MLTRHYGFEGRNQMARGPSKYDEIATVARESAKAAGVILIVLDGEHGSGFSLQTHDLRLVTSTPKILRDLADSIEKDMVPA